MKKSEIQLTFDGVFVDAGIIGFFDFDYANTELSEEYNFDPSDLGDGTFLREVPPGEYKILVNILETWNGDVTKESIINLPSGKLLVTDPCYMSNDQDLWLQYCEDYVFSAVDGDKHCFIDSMGGDGIYKVDVKLEKLS